MENVILRGSLGGVSRRRKKFGNSEEKKLYMKSSIKAEISQQDLECFSKQTAQMIFSVTPYPFSKVSVRYLKLVNITAEILDDNGDVTGEKIDFNNVTIDGFSIKNDGGLLKIEFGCYFPSTNDYEALVALDDKLQFEIKF